MRLTDRSPAALVTPHGLVAAIVSPFFAVCTIAAVDKLPSAL